MSTRPFFPATPHCFPPLDTWHHLIPFAKMNIDENFLELGLKVGICVTLCQKNISVESLGRVSVQAHGPSHWLLERPPHHCDFTDPDLSLSPSSRPVCLHPPTSSPQTTTSIIVSVTAAWAVIVMVFLTTVTAVLIRRKSQHQHQHQQQQHPATVRE